MKLLLCTKCSEVFNLSKVYAECSGKHGGGEYIDDINARVVGPKDTIFVLGFSNPSLIGALRDQRDYGDLPPDTVYGNIIGEKVSMGREFKAFIIPESAKSIVRTENGPNTNSTEVTG